MTRELSPVAPNVSDEVEFVSVVAAAQTRRRARRHPYEQGTVAVAVSFFVFVLVGTEAAMKPGS